MSSSTQAVTEHITFTYTDSGPPLTSDDNKSNHCTLFMIHGHTIHSGVFQKISALAPSNSLRIICINRREYQGSTPYTGEELRIIHEGSESERWNLLVNEGLHLALFIDKLTQDLDLSTDDTHGALVGWSMGIVFLLAIINSINHPNLPPQTKDQLKKFINTIILWGEFDPLFLLSDYLNMMADPPSELLGFDNPPGCYHPLWDEAIPLGERNAAFGKWVASYFEHVPEAISSKDATLLNQRNPSSRTPTTETMSREEHLSISDFRVGPKCDTIMTEPPFHEVHQQNVHQALFDSDSNVSKWGIQNIWHIYGDKALWNIISSVWGLEEKDRNNKRIVFSPIKGGNHLVMWDDPGLALNTLNHCVKS